MKNMTVPLMPKATAVWLIENTKLTFDQIAEFCAMHPLEVKGIADGEVAGSIIGINPVTAGQLTYEDIKKCENNPKLKLNLLSSIKKHIESIRKKTSRYTPVARRGDKPDAIMWLLKTCPEINDNQIIKLIGTTRSTIETIKSKHHWNMANIKPRDPVLLGICTQTELDSVLEKARLHAKTKSTE